MAWHANGQFDPVEDTPFITSPTNTPVGLDIASSEDTQDGHPIGNEDAVWKKDHAITVAEHDKDTNQEPQKKKWWQKGKKKKEKKEKPPAVAFKALFRFADWKDKCLMCFSFVCATIVGASLPAFCYLFGALMNDLNNATAQEIEQKTNEICLIMTLIGVAEWVLCTLYVAAIEVSSARQMRILRTTFFSSILKQEVAFFDGEKSGELTNRLSSDVQIISGLMGVKIANLVQYVATFFFAYAFAFWQSWRLTLIMLCVMPIMAVCGGIMAKLVANFTTKAQDTYATAGGIAQEVLSSIRTVQAFCAMERECERYGVKITEVEKVGIKKGFWLGMSQGVTFFVLFGSYALAFYYGSYLIEWGLNTGGTVVAVFFSVLIGAFQMGAAGPIFTDIAQARGAAYHVYHIIDRHPSMVVDDPTSEKLESLQGQIEFNHVAFRYPSRSDVPIFNDLNLTIKPGQTVALVGPSGSGKSSIISLIERFYDVEGGNITVDGVQLQKLNLQWWREQIGIVTQEPTLFSASVLDNIKYANPAATQEDIIQACKDAYIHDVISKLPNGYDTQVGEGGSQLSGGQKQRVAIARAIIKNPKILLLDEATSALDRQSEMIVQEALQNVMRGRTVITIAHRLVTIQDADLICYIEPRDPSAPEGSYASFSHLLESGSHKVLVAQNGAYARMWNTQMQAEQGPESPGSPSSPSVLKKHGLTFEQANEEVFHDVEESAGNKQGKRDKAKAKAENKKSKLASLKRTAKLNKPEWCWVTLGVIASAIAGTSYPIYAVLFSEVVNVFYQPNIREEVWKWCLLFVGLGTLNLISIVVKLYCLNYAGEKLTTRLRAMLFRALVHMEIGFFDMPGNESGALCARLASDTTEIQHLWGGAIGTNVQAGVCLVMGIIIAFIVSWNLALVTASAVPAMILAGIINTKFMFGFNQKSGTAFEAAQQVATESISGCRTVFAFNMQKAQVTRYDSLLEGPRRQALIKGIVSGFFFGFSQFIIFGAFALSYWYGGQLVADGTLTFDQVLKCSFALLMGAMGVGEVYSMAGDQTSAVQAADRVYEILDRVPAIDTTAGGQVLAQVQGSGSFKDVGFSYPSRPDVKILRHLNLDFASGQRIALLGSTGCGKSTIISLLMRYYDPTRGDIDIDGVALKDLDVNKWRDRIGIVSQEPVLFDDTIEANIKYGKPDATEAEVHLAAKRAHMHQTIMSLPDGYKTQVGAKGSQLSGGQKQRVAIARCIIRKPQVLLLDEATSALDNVSEREVQAALDEIITADRMTVITVAHRLTTIKNCNMIVIMDHGKILEQGTHEELYALGGDYKRRYDQYYGL
mmetsp:Transcript_52007/g.92801  ORF Transcript_52007/g.92801 Transcript_52007/m.92801 type:complete len:1319 (-) Transcript_52007:1058-5014(-)